MIYQFFKDMMHIDDSKLNIIDWLSEFFKKELSKINEKIPEEITEDSFTLIDEKSNNDEINVILGINDSSITCRLADKVIGIINPVIIQKISEKQELAYKIDKTGILNVECCICLEENKPMIAIECAHSICQNCYLQLSNRDISNCPMCRKTMKNISINKLYAVMTNVDKSNTSISIGILHMPPIYSEQDNMWLEQEIFWNINTDSEQFDKFVCAYNRINTERYVVVFQNKSILSYLNKLINSGTISSFQNGEIGLENFN